ncbi:MAG: putative T7SS-secreted protein [Nocardioides sp.]
MSAPPSLELGQTDDPALLIPGNPGVVQQNADAIADEKTLITTARDDVRAIRSEDAIDAGLSSLAYLVDRGSLLTKYDGFIEVLTTAHGALTTYVGRLRAAQDVAQDAITKWNEGEEATRTARAQWEAAVQAYENAACAPPTVQYLNGRSYTIPSISQGDPGAFVDPGESIRAEAKEILEGGRADLLEAARAAMRTLGAPSEEDDDGEGSSSGDVDWLGADGSAEGPSISWDFWEKKFGDQTGGEDAADGGEDSPFKISLGEIEGGIYVFNAEGEFENYYGDVKVNGDGSVTVLGADGSATATIDKDGVKIGVDGTITVVGAEGSIHGSLGLAELGLEGEVLVGATGEGEISIGKQGVHANGELFAGGKIEGAINGDIGGVGGEGRAEGWAGFGISGNADLGYKDGKLTVGGDGGVAVFLGGKLGGEVTLDFPEIYETGEDIVGWLVPG